MSLKKVALAAAFLVPASLGHAAVVNVGTLGALQAAISPDTLTIFSFNDGIGSGVKAGNSYSSDFTLSSIASGTYGGSSSPNVSDSGLEAGPISGYTGILRVDFASVVSAFSFTSYQFDGSEELRVYDGATVLATFLASSLGSGFPNFAGFYGSAGEQISAIELEGRFFSLGELGYDSVPTVPVPAPAALLLAGVGALAAMRRRKA